MYMDKPLRWIAAPDRQKLTTYADPAQELSKQARGEAVDRALVNTKNRGTVAAAVVPVILTMARSMDLSDRVPSIRSLHVMYLNTRCTCGTLFTFNTKPQSLHTREPACRRQTQRTGCWRPGSEWSTQTSRQTLLLW
jgi:hypothetical protein